MKIRIFDADNGVMLQDVSQCELVVVKTDESKEDLYKEIGKRIYGEWEDLRSKMDDFTGMYGVAIDVRFKNINKDPLSWKE